MELSTSYHNKRPSILTIEDETGLRKSIADYFEDSGFTVFEAADGREGLAAFREHNPDIVFADLCMPHCHGLEIIPVMHRESPTTPVVVVSGAGMLADAVEAMKRGAWDYVAKPVRELASLEQLAYKMLARSNELKQEYEFTRQLKEQLEGYQVCDTLTGLPDRKFFSRHFEKIRLLNPDICLGLVDLDNFKAIKEVFGHEAGDLLLKEVANRLNSIVHGNDMLSRLGGDEFGFLINFYAPMTPDDMDTIVMLVNNCFTSPFNINEQELYVTASIGLTAFPADGTTIDDLLKNADTALSSAKEQGQNSYRIYSSDIIARSADQLNLQATLRRALEKDEFVLHYQPQVDVASGKMTGVEALLRWESVSGQLFNPADFIPALEESRLIIPVGEWALKTACLQQRDWVESGYPELMLSVNVSAVQFHSAQFAERLAMIIEDTGVDPAYLCLELTESIVMKDVEETIHTLMRLRELGVSLSLDDFGTGYSSLSYLRKMPISELKIDRSFISSLFENQNSAMIVSTIISMAHCFNMRVVAEGVETMDQLEYLRANLCQTAQGFLFSKPMHPDVITASLPSADWPGFNMQPTV